MPMFIPITNAACNCVVLRKTKLPTENSPVWHGGAIPPNDGFFDRTATFVGAFGASDWTAGWSGFSTQVPAAIESSHTDQMVAEYRLQQNYPNPFDPSTTIAYYLPKADRVDLSVYNSMGQKVAELVNEYKAAGHHRSTFQAYTLPSGLYFYRLCTGDVVLNKQWLFLKYAAKVSVK